MPYDFYIFAVKWILQLSIYYLLNAKVFLRAERQNFQPFILCSRGHTSQSRLPQLSSQAATLSHHIVFYFYFYFFYRVCCSSYYCCRRVHFTLALPTPVENNKKKCFVFFFFKVYYELCSNTGWIGQVCFSTVCRINNLTSTLLTYVKPLSVFTCIYLPAYAASYEGLQGLLTDSLAFPGPPQAT